jgi:hypothetical protein
MPVVAPLVAVATVGASGYSAYASYKGVQNAEEANKAALAEQEKQNRIAQVQSIKQETLNAINDINAPEWNAFYDFSLSNSDNPDTVATEAKKQLAVYNARTQSSRQVYTAQTNETSKEDVPVTSSNLSLDSLAIPLLSMMASQNQQQVSPAFYTPALTVKESKPAIDPTLLAAGAAVLGFFLIMKRR